MILLMTVTVTVILTRRISSMKPIAAAVTILTEPILLPTRVLNGGRILTALTALVLRHRFITLVFLIKTIRL